MNSLVNASICSLVMWKTVFRHLRKAFIMICKDSENFMSLSSSTNSRKSQFGHLYFVAAQEQASYSA